MYEIGNHDLAIQQDVFGAPGSSTRLRMRQVVVALAVTVTAAIVMTSLLSLSLLS